jgi:hypothetical protein
VDGYIFKDTPTVLVNQGKFSHVPMLVGSTTDESAAGSANFDFDREMKGIWPALSQSDLTVIKEAYKSSDFKNEKERVVTAVGETMNRCPVRTLFVSNATQRAISLSSIHSFMGNQDFSHKPLDRESYLQRHKPVLVMWCMLTASMNQIQRKTPQKFNTPLKIGGCSRAPT